MLAATALSGCSTLPGQGPLADEVAKGATSDVGEVRYALIDVNEQTIAALARHVPATFHKAFGDYRPAPSPLIGVGDSLRVTVWEAAAGGLFSAPSIGGVTTGAHSAVIPDQVVGRDGSITVPYAGRVRVLGLTPRDVERTIVRQLTGKAIEPQALVTVSGAVSNSATVTGEVTTGGRVPLTVRGDRILDVVEIGRAHV